MIKDVIWDFDGTLFNSYPYLAGALKYALALSGIDEPLDGIIAKFMDCERAALEFFGGKYSIADKLRRDYFKCKAEGDLATILPFPGSKEACEGVIKAGARNFILTHRDDSAKRIVAMNGMSECFTDIVTSDNGFKRKPDPEGVNYLISRYDMTRAQTMIVGDRELEVELGRNAGIVSCFFNNGDARCLTKPDYTISALNDGKLIAIIEGRRQPYGV